MRGDPYVARLVLGLTRPKERIRGTDFAGVVEAVGRDVTRLRPGDEVFGEADGAFAEYVCASQDVVGAKPSNLTFEQAAAVPLAGNTALMGLRDLGRVRPGQRVLVNGASGGVGTFAVQIAKAFGAEVTGVCSTKNADLVRSLGADHVIDYTREDFTRNGPRYDVVFDLVGNRSLALSRFAGRQRLLVLTAEPKRENLEALTELVERGDVSPVVDRTYPLGEAAEAIRYLEVEHARAKVVVTV